MTSHELKRIAKVWHSLATGGKVDHDDDFFQFIAIWVAFNALYASRTTSKGDKARLKKFAEASDAIEIHGNLLRSDPSYVTAVEFLKEGGVLDLDRNKRAEITSREDLKEVLLCVYKVRNNLFHGGKIPGGKRNTQLVKQSYVILNKLLASLV